MWEANVFESIFRFFSFAVFAQRFLERVEESLMNENNPHKFTEFMSILRNFNENQAQLCGADLYLVSRPTTFVVFLQNPKKNRSFCKKIASMFDPFVNSKNNEFTFSGFFPLRCLKNSSCPTIQTLWNFFCIFCCPAMLSKSINPWTIFSK